MMYRSERPDKGTIVYVGGLVGDIKKEDLEVEFGKFGKLSRVWVAFNPPGFAFVEFTNKNDAKAAVDALNNETALGSKLRVEISRGRGRGSRGGGPGRGGSDRGASGHFSRGGRGSFRGGRGDFMGGRNSDFGQGRGGITRGSFGGNHPFEDDYKPFRGGDLGSRFDDFEDRRRSEFAERDFGAARDFGRRDVGLNRHYGDESSRGFSALLDGNYDNVSASRGFGAGGRDVGSRDFGSRDFTPRDVQDRDYGAIRDIRNIRDFAGRDYGDDRDINGTRNFGAAHDVPLERGYGAERDTRPRDFATASQANLGRDFGESRDGAPVHSIGERRDYGGRDYGGGRDIGLRRESDIRDFNPPRDQADQRDFSGRPSRIDYAETNRFGTGGRGGFGNGDVRRSGGFDAGRYSGGDVGGTGDYGSYGARDRFRSRSPIGRVSRPLY